VKEISLIGLLALATSVLPAAAAAPDAAARQRLHQQQLQDSLNLDLQQGLARSRARASGVNPRALDELALRQRLEQQQLETHQAQELGRLRHDPRSQALRQRQFQLEREAQMQRFEGERQRLLGTTTPPPLQPTPRSGELQLP
jgi:hypothetical protein